MCILYMHLHTDVRLHSFRPALLSEAQRCRPLLAPTMRKSPEGALPSGRSIAGPAPCAPPGEEPAWSWNPDPSRSHCQGGRGQGAGRGTAPCLTRPGAQGPPRGGASSSRWPSPVSRRHRPQRRPPPQRPSSQGALSVPSSLCPAATCRARPTVGPCP